MGLIADIQSDMEKGAIRLISEYRLRLVSDAQRLCENPSDVDDLVSRTLVKVISNIDSHDETCDFYAWMKSIMVNLHRNDLARPIVRGTVAVDESTLEQCAGADWSTDEQLLKNSDSEAIRQAISELDPKYNQVMLMRYYDEFSLKEIANFLCLPMGTISRRVQIAHRILAGKLRVEFGKAKKPLAVLLAALLGIGSLFGAWQAGILDPLFSQSGETVQSGEADKSGAIAQAIGEALPESFPLQEEAVSNQTQSQSETGLAQEKTVSTQTESKERQDMNMKTVKTFAASVVVAASAAVANASTTGEYVQDGLVAMWDGYENNGAGGHATELTEWKDTSGTYPFVFNANSGITVGGSALVFTGASGCYATLNATDTAATFDKAKDGTMEIVFKPAADRATTCLLLRSSATSGIALGHYNSRRAWYVSNKNSPGLSFDCPEEIVTMAIPYSNGVASAPYLNGQVLATSGTGYWSGSPTATTLGATSDGTRLFKGAIYAIRLYSKQLTSSQIAANSVVDVKRFVKGDVYPAGSVYVRGEPQNYALDSESPVYGIVDKKVGEDIYLTAPEYGEISATERAYCVGWKLYDRATGDLIGESTDETRCSFTHTYKKPVRLDWQWDVRHPVTVSAAAGLSVTPATAWGSVAFPAKFTVEGADFPLWSGDGLLSEVHAKTALFAPTNVTAATVAKAVVRTPTDIAALQSAIASSAGGDVIVLPDGTNSLADATSENLTIAKAVLVTSRSGDPKDVAVDLGGTGWGFTLTAPGARLRGITFISSVDIKEDSSTHPLPRFVNIITGTVDTCVFRDINITGARYGGFAPVCLFADGVIDNCVFTNIINKTAYMQPPYGTVYATGGLITRTKFFRCDTYLAPVISAGPSTLTVEDCLFTGYTQNSESVGQYSGVYGTSPFVVRRSVFSKNSTCKAVVCFAPKSGADAWLEDCVFTSNVSAKGPGVFAVGGRGNPIFNRCVMEGNAGSDCGVAMLGASCTTIMRNCLLCGNMGTSTAGAVYGVPSSSVFARFENCTVTGNKTENGDYPGIAIVGCGNTAQTWVKNCIVYGNGQGVRDSQLLVDEDRVFTSCYPEAANGNAAGNTPDDPKLRKVKRCRYYPSPSGSCYEAGDASIWTEDDVDLAGKPRLRDGKVDIGCYQALPLNGLILMVK